MSYPGLDSQSKAYLWKSVLVCAPCLTFGCDSLFLNECNEMKLDSTQGTLVKQCLGLGKRSHHSHLLGALDICKVNLIVLKGKA